MKNLAILGLLLLAGQAARADIVSSDANGQISVQTGKMLNLCVDSASAACGTIKAGLGVSGRVGIGKTNPATALDVNGTVTATQAIYASTITALSLGLGVVTAPAYTLDVDASDTSGDVTTARIGSASDAWVIDSAAAGAGNGNRILAQRGNPNRLQFGGAAALTSMNRKNVEFGYFAAGGTAGIALTANNAQFITMSSAGYLGIDPTITGSSAAWAATPLDVNGAAQFGATGKSTFTATGSLTMAPATTVQVSSSATSAFTLTLDAAYTTAQIQAKTPANPGMIVWNSTLGNICVSTGTIGAMTVQGYKLAGTASTTCQ